MNLQAQVREALAPGGCVAQALKQFHARPQQNAMAQAVAQAVVEGGNWVIEAGTGVGKTYAYLVPALLSGERVLVSTATKALQDQLFTRDLPRLVKALALPIHIAVLKGRASYVCPHRLTLARQGLEQQNAAQINQWMPLLARIEDWALHTRSGDLAEVPDLDERSALIPWVTSTRDNCLGSACPKLQDCHVNLARRTAMAADLVVVNHHLYFADLAVRESEVAELLPSARVVIFDEAHQLSDVGVQFLGINWGTSQLLDLARDVLVAGIQHARGLADWQDVASDLERSAQELRLSVASLGAGSKLEWSGSAPQGVHPQDWADSLGSVESACRYAAKQLSQVSEIAPDFVRLAARAAEHAQRAAAFSEPAAPLTVRWVEATNGRASSAQASPLRLVESPLDVSRAFSDAADSDDSVPKDRGQERPPTRIFTSATLGNDAKLSWFCDACGLVDAHVLRFESPFDYASQAALYVPAPDFPAPADSGHSLAVAQLAAKATERLGGRTLVLTTTLKALAVVGDYLQQRFPIGSALEVLVQGQQPKRYLMDRFRAQSGDGHAGSVLVASATFWEGFDVPGEALQLVVIDKLPFPPPSDPLVQARSQRLQAQKRSPFNDYFIPQATVALKQGAGRLIRHESDRGVLVVADTRLVSKPYGRRILKALPFTRRLDSEEALMQELDDLKGG